MNAMTSATAVGDTQCVSAETPVVPTYCLVNGTGMRITRCQHVFARQNSQEGWQEAPLLERAGNRSCRLRPSRAATRTVSQRDQLLARTRLAQVDLGDRGRVAGGAAQHALFPEDRCEGLPPDESIVRWRHQGDATAPPPATGTCWLALTPWQTLDLDVFRAERPPPSRKGNPLGSGGVRATPYPLHAASQAVSDLREGRIQGAAVLVPKSMRMDGSRSASNRPRRNSMLRRSVCGRHEQDFTARRAATPSSD
jgi:hypothetical protein